MKLWTMALVFVLAAGLSVAQGKGGRKGGAIATDPAIVKGKITAVAKLKDKADTVIVIKPAGGKKLAIEETAVLVKADTKIFIDGQEGKLTDLKPGSQASANVTDSAATRIDVTSAAAKGGGKAKAQ